MSNDKTGGPAFPYPYETQRSDGIHEQLFYEPGMSLRDYFAAAALNGVQMMQLAEIEAGTIEQGKDHSLDLGLMAYAIADAMLRARDQ